MSNRVLPGALLQGFTGASFLLDQTNAEPDVPFRVPESHLRSPASHSRNAQIELAKHIYEMRRARALFLPPDMFAEPAWDILLYLYGAGAAQQRVTVSAVCSSAGVPVSTALRWIQRLAITGMITKESHPTDNRISWVRLSKDGQCQLDRFFDRLCGQNSD